MKIYINGLFLSQNVSGVQRYSIEISKELKKLLGEDIKILSPRNIIHTELAYELDAEIIGKFDGLLWEQLDLYKYMAAQKDALLLNLRNSAPLLYKKNILVVHDLIFMKNKKWFSKNFQLIYKKSMPILLKNSLKIITVSNFSKQDIVNTFDIDPEKIDIIYGAVSKKFAKSNLQSICHSELVSRSEILKQVQNEVSMEQNNVSTKNDTNQNGKYILTVASCLSPRKNLFNIIKAYENLGMPDIKLIIVGAESNNFSDKSILKEIKSNKNIILTGYIKDEELAELYRHACLFVFPSLFEGFGLPPLEAMACGCPVIASDLASLPEICTDAAFYVNPLNINEIKTAMQKILYDNRLRNSLIQKGEERAKYFNWQKSAADLAKIIKVINERDKI